jgi:hypothetical protein
MTKIRTTLALAAMLLGAAAPTHAIVAWDETTQGDLSSNGLAPTVLTIDAGINTVLGSVGNSGAGVDRDYFSFSVPAGWQLSSMILRPETNISGSASFLAIQAGPQVTVSPSGAGAAALLGYVLYGTDQIGNNLLQDMALPGGVLGSGTYSVWVQELGGLSPYGLDLIVAEVPEPGSAALLLAGLLGAAALRRRALR